MKFMETPLKGAYVIDIEKNGDNRGFFARVFCQNEFKDNGLSTEFRQVNNSFSALKGTLRGLHYQLMPSAEVKVVRCINGALFDVILDLRPDSPNFGQWFGDILNSENRRMMYVPRGFAHGFITLSNNTEVFYYSSEFYVPKLEKGIRFDDPHFNIEWPIKPTEVSEKDANWQLYDADWHGVNLLKGLV
jgi:dTDP-4-dehydrorhamnose 3,5-epimerase